MFKIKKYYFSGILIINSPSFEYEYFFRRTCVNDVIDFILTDGRVAIIHSDLANGKSVTLRQLETELQGKASVYKMNHIYNVALADDLEYIASQRGIHVILCEDYNQIIDSELWNIILKYQYSNIKYVFTARSYINDNFWGRVYKDIDLDENSFAMYDINELNSEEILEFEKLISSYDLWGKRYSRNKSQRIKQLKKKNKCEIRDVLIDLYKSPQVIDRIDSIVSLLAKNDDVRNILIYSFICNILSIEAEVFEISNLFGTDLIRRIKSTTCGEIKELVQFERNSIKLKSSSIARYILHNNQYNKDVLKILKLI